MFTFGGAVTDVIAHTAMPLSPYGQNRAALTTIWMYPTTLTATRRIIGAGTVSGVAIDTTTSSVRLILDAATTDGVWTAPVGLATNTPIFLAVLSHMNSAGGTAAVKMWSGTADSAPTEKTVTQATAPVGAWVDSSTTLHVGNVSGGSLAFQGDLGGFCVCAEDHANAPTSPLGIDSAVGVLSQVDADNVFRRLVVPLWYGDLPTIAGEGRQLDVMSTGGTTVYGFSIASTYDRGTANNGAWAVYGNAVRSRGTVTGAVANLSRFVPRNSFEESHHNKMAVSGGRRRYVVVT